MVKKNDFFIKKYVALFLLMEEEKKKNNKNKEWMGMPMSWNIKNVPKTLWNPNDDNIFPPKSFGIGWSVNFHALLRAMGFLKKK